MLTCLEIVNILYYKCVDLCHDIKYKYNRVFNNNSNRLSRIIIIVFMKMIQIT